MERQGTRADRRASRTRTLLHQAFLEVLRQKRFDSITIQDITEQADVNRTTFYAISPISTRSWNPPYAPSSGRRWQAGSPRWAAGGTRPAYAC